MIGAELPPPEHDSEEVRRLVEEVLSRPEFDRPAPTLLEQLQDAFGELVGRVLEGVVGSGAGGVIAWIVIAAAVGLVAALLTRYGRTVQADRVTGGVPAMIEMSRSPAQWRAEAERAEAEGRWKHGLLARYRALVGHLVAEGVLDEVAGRTTGEYRRELAERRPEAAEAFAEATALFEGAWYGDEATGPAERDRFVTADLELTGARR